MSERDSVETRTVHYYEFYGRRLQGYGSSMDQHHCGDPSEPCVTITEERHMTPWRVMSRTYIPDSPATDPASVSGRDGLEGK